MAGRNIFENVLINHDLIYPYKRRHASPGCLMKIDLQKAYDSVSKAFLIKPLMVLGFVINSLNGVFIRVSIAMLFL